MQIFFIGGALEIGGSCILVKLREKNILLDSGLRQGGGKDPIPDFRMIQEAGGVDAIIISHAHIDHTGTLPLISKEYPLAPIYMNRMTRDLVRVLLYDSLKIMNFNEGEIPIYQEADVENMFSRIITINFEGEAEICADIHLTFYQAGHVAGAACVYLKTAEGALFYSGDFSLFDQKTVAGMKIPRLRPDIAIIESTYGDKLHANRDLEENRLIDFVEEMESAQGKMLIPAFALGRAQEVIQILRKAKNLGRLKDIPVYVDGMVKNINGVYRQNPLYLKSNLARRIFRGTDPFYDKTIRPIQQKEEREKLFSSDKGFIVLSSSGMLAGGPSQFYAEKIASLTEGCILITGYQDEEAPGRQLLNLLADREKERVLEINGKAVQVKCRIERVALSAHADKSEIINLVAALQPRNLFLVHGAEESTRSLARELAAQYRGRLYLPACGAVFDINLEKIRKQLEKNFPETLHKEEGLSEAGLEELWNFSGKHYPEKNFTIEELLLLWHGRRITDDKVLSAAQEAIINSPWFACDRKRLFLFKAQSRSAVEEMHNGAPTQQDILITAEKLFKPYGCHKISLMLPDRKVLLNFDFPQAVNSGIKISMEEFTKKTGWDVEINPRMNIHAAENLVRSLFSAFPVKKVSHYPGEGRIVAVFHTPVTLSGEDTIFREKTGMSLEIKTAAFSPSDTGSSPLLSRTGEEQMEQNQALQYIDHAFGTEPDRPYKKGIKNSSEGRYIELAFISPVIGRRYLEKIAGLSRETGWQLEIGDVVNQNEVINCAKRLCSAAGILLKKNPSFNPADSAVTIKPEQTGDAGMEKLQEDFLQQTGCRLIVDRG